MGNRSCGRLSALRRVLRGNRDARHLPRLRVSAMAALDVDATTRRPSVDSAGALTPAGVVDCHGGLPPQLPSVRDHCSCLSPWSYRKLAGVPRRRSSEALLIAIVASAAACLAVLLPYRHRGDLYRAVPATASVRADHAFGLVDLFGLYLNSFAWHSDGSITAWAVSVPVLIGLALVTRDILRRQLPLVAGGGIALTLATTPKIGPIGRAMVALGPLFPSRFPAADYKAGVAVALVVLSAHGWSELAARSVGRIRGAAAFGGVLLLGAVLAPSTYASATRALWLLFAVTLATVALALARPNGRVLVLLLIALIAVDGYREAQAVPWGKCRRGKRRQRT